MRTAENTRERILNAAEDLLRRHGPTKTNVVDIARALGMSHANVYRFVPNKAALIDAVAARWLDRVSAPLETIARNDLPAADRLVLWLRTLASTKRKKLLEDPEMFATWHALAEAARGVIDEHLAALQGQLQRIVEDGSRRGEFRVVDAEAAARAIFEATLRFHHPHHLRNEGAGSEPGFEAVMKLLVAGLRAGVL